MLEDYLFKNESFKIIGILFEVHKTLGKGFSEIVYKDALEYEFQTNNISYQREKEFVVNYKDTVLKYKFYAYFVVFDKIILEIKTVECLGSCGTAPMFQIGAKFYENLTFEKVDTILDDLRQENKRSRYL